ncbi:glutaredoxin family protein [Legionella yabuuchiae]|uniref:glutaredoxin family protein n=1 Tax=Legionella yabuuchiae TaxID=376727 RepID=UPI001056C74A|nr:hypothetical protein [Legionella yabuuchiae]
MNQPLTRQTTGIHCFLTFCMVLILFPAHAVVNSTPWYTTGTNHQVTLKVDFFMSSTCPHCHKADEFFKTIEPNYPWLEIKRHVIDKDKAALKLFYERLQALDVNNFAVPAFFFCGSRWVGFADPERSGKPLLSAMKYCYEQIKKHGELPQATIRVLKAKGTASQFEIDNWIARSPQLFVPLSGLMDAITPCSLFIYLVLLAYISLHSGFKVLQYLIAMTYLITILAFAFFELAFTNQFYAVINALRWPAGIIGLFLVWYLVFYGRGAKMKPGQRLPMVLPMVILTTALVFFYQQACLMNIGMIFDQWLSGQTLTTTERYTYIGIYLVSYLIPFILFSLVYLFLIHLRRFQTYHEHLYLSGWTFLLGVGVFLIIKPLWLSKLMYSYMVLLIAILVGWFLPYWRARHEKR